MFHDIVFLAIGLVLILLGGSMVTDGAESIARRFRISEVVIGLTVVAFGSSTPDLVVSLMATVSHKSGLALGDVVGANIFDILLVTGVVAIVSPVALSPKMATKNLPMLFLSSLALFFCGDDILIDDSTVDVVSRTDGLLLLCFFMIFMSVTLAMRNDPSPSISVPESGTLKREQAELKNLKSKINMLENRVLSRLHIRMGEKPESNIKSLGLGVSAIYVVGGLAALVVGGNWIVDGASGIAHKAGLSEALIGLTVVALGSSLPDLATSLIAALKNRPGLAIGNIVGACIFNVFFIIGTCSVVAPLKADNITFVDFGTLLLGAFMVMVFANMGKRHLLTRWQGWILVLSYVAYMSYLIIFTT